METIVDLEPEAYQMAQARTAERGISIGKVLSDPLLGRTGESRLKRVLAIDDNAGWA